MALVKKSATKEFIQNGTSSSGGTADGKTSAVAAREAEDQRKKARTLAKQQRALNNFMHGRNTDPPHTR